MSDDIVREFLVESNENLDSLDRELVQLEKEPTNRERLASIFRTIHTIKGTCGFLGFTRLESVAHVGENVLSRLRDGKLILNPELATVLLRMVDAVRQMLQSIESTGSDGERDDEALIATLTTLYEGESQAKQGEGEMAGTGFAGNKPEQGPGTRRVTENGDIAGGQARQAAKAGRSEAETQKPRREEGDEARMEAAEQQQVSAGARAGLSDASIRVDVVLLDNLMNLVGELVLARNQILQFSNTTEQAGLIASSQRLNLITTELQEGVMKTRMQPIGNVWSKFPRTVRDVATACGKQIRLDMEGKETELDKTIIEAIKDPLTHIVRNSADHGIETPEVRVAAGKSPEGRLLLRAYHEGGQVNIEISDDGAGLDIEKLRRKAIEKGLITAEQSARMGDREIANLTFLPGFSTADTVTNVSGRGVGMDVVRTNIEKIGGTVDLHSKAGAGTTVKMKIPLTLAIIPALIVTTGGDRYAIPQISLLELVRLDGEDAQKGIELIQGAPVYRLRGRLLPLVYLNRELKVETAAQEGKAEGEAPPAELVNIVVLQADGRQFGLVVSEINDTEEIVVKPLGKQLKGIKTFAGSTIMGDGRVALILDVLGLAQASSVVTEEVHDRTRADKEERAAAVQNRRQTLLLFTGPDNGYMAVPLDHVGRLEEFPISSIEAAGTIDVVQYRGEILPLMFLADILEERRGEFRRTVVPPKKEDADQLQCIVYSCDGKRIGLVIEQILDIVNETAQAVSPSSRAGVLCTAVIQGRVTEMLDMPALMHAFESHNHAGEMQHEAVAV